MADDSKLIAGVAGFQAYMIAAVYPPCQPCLAKDVVSPHMPPQFAGNLCPNCGTPFLPARETRIEHDITIEEVTNG